MQSPMARSQLSVLIRQCLHQRKPPQEFDELLGLAIRKWKSTGVEIVAGLIKAAFGFCLDNDPLVSGYLQAILTSQRSQVSECLIVFIRHWQASAKKGACEDANYARVLAQLVADLMVIISGLPVTTQEARRCMMVSSRWLQTLFGLAAHHGEKHNDEHISLLVNALGSLLITIMNTPAGLAAMKVSEDAKEDPLNVAIRQAMHGSMTTFPDFSVQLMSEAGKHSVLDDSSDADANNAQVMAALTFQNNIVNPQIVPSRTATYISLYTKLLHGATIDDNALYNYLDTRYSGNTALMFNDLLSSSFDILTKPSQSQDPVHQAQCRIFLHNKLPMVLATIANPLQPLPTEQYLHDLWNEITSLGNEEVLTMTRHFLHICALHHLISQEATQSLTGEDANSTSAKGLFPKQALVDQVKANPTRGPRLIEELAKNDGNAGFLSQAIVEIMHRYCHAKETQHIKEMAIAMVCQPTTINALGVFVKPSYFLAPLCRLLDEWSWEDIHGESQPIYEEFGSVLLLIMSTKFRLGLSNNELGLTSHTGFVAHYLSSGQSEKILSQMDESEKDNLGDWIHNLYESEGISDEVTSSCSAKKFYLMVPTLLRQSMTALALGKLPQDRLEGGLDYLLEPFLIPSLLSSFAWLARSVIKDAKNTMIIIRRLMRTPENADTSKIHRTILQIAYGMFTDALAHIPDKSQYEELWGLFDGIGPFSINIGFKAEDLRLWTHEDGGTAGCLKRAISNMLSSPNVGIYQPNLLMAAVQMRGPSTVLHEIISMLVQFASSNQFPHTQLDVMATLIACAEVPGVSLRNYLQLLHARVGTFVKNGDPVFAEALVHLYRRVELYATALTPQPGGEDQLLNNVDGIDLAEINLDQLPLETDISKQQSTQLSQPDPTGGENLDQMLNDAVNMGSMDDYAMNDENMFDMENFDLTNIDELDMSMFT